MPPRSAAPRLGWWGIPALPRPGLLRIRGKWFAAVAGLRVKPPRGIEELVERVVNRMLPILTARVDVVTLNTAPRGKEAGAVRGQPVAVTSVAEPAGRPGKAKKVKDGAKLATAMAPGTKGRRTAAAPVPTPSSSQPTPVGVEWSRVVGRRVKKAEKIKRPRPRAAGP